MGVSKGSFQKHFKHRGWVKAKVVSKGGGFRMCHYPCPPENFNHTPMILIKIKQHDGQNISDFIAYFMIVYMISLTFRNVLIASTCKLKCF